MPYHFNNSTRYMDPTDGRCFLDDLPAESLVELQKLQTSLQHQKPESTDALNYNPDKSLLHVGLGFDFIQVTFGEMPPSHHRKFNEPRATSACQPCRDAHRKCNGSRPRCAKHGREFTDEQRQHHGFPGMPATPASSDEIEPR
ncbi:hypothetical protein BC938DRAFT_472051 [Jimgerdemannia flammicorona]|uniref:Zn(2)-C6 fungal-type domain-containing protein n=1 Tax=Jimgerdemannia flammicorona TaxID=994334 RepID=A0A433QU80_9FUNG|nr:hypothetical protein BC938DRAFT_472051 [Jimgerdemannia flammicorona]